MYFPGHQNHNVPAQSARAGNSTSASGHCTDPGRIQRELPHQRASRGAKRFYPKMNFSPPPLNKNEMKGTITPVGHRSEGPGRQSRQTRGNSASTHTRPFIAESVDSSNCARGTTPPFTCARPRNFLIFSPLRRKSATRGGTFYFRGFPFVAGFLRTGLGRGFTGRANSGGDQPIGEAICGPRGQS